MGGGRTGKGKTGGGRGRGRGGKARKKGSNQSLVPGPPRLENVAPDKLDEVHVFREKRPTRCVQQIKWYTRQQCFSTCVALSILSMLSISDNATDNRLYKQMPTTPALLV